MKSKLKQNNAVTLVALVVTIIVLVILATVSIGMVLRKPRNIYTGRRGEKINGKCTSCGRGEL